MPPGDRLADCAYHQPWAPIQIQLCEPRLFGNPLWQRNNILVSQRNLGECTTQVLLHRLPPFAHNDSTAYVYRDEIIDHNAKRLESFAHNVKKGGRALQEISGALARGDFTWNALGVAFRRGFTTSSR